MIGTRLGNRYEIQELIGEGGMASAYRSWDERLNRTVAVKILKNHLAGDDDFVRRFRREAQAAAGLTHPNVVNVYDVGLDEGHHYIVMEYVKGQTLKDRIREEGKLSAEEAVRIAWQVAHAIEHAHAFQVIHRDIKPQNILLSQRGEVKVADFGIALAANASQTITFGEPIMGSVQYFSPEQAKGGTVGEQSDIYSLGIVLYEMFTGEVPFTGESPISTALKHLNEEIIPPRELVPDLPSKLERVVLKSLQKDPSRRYLHISELKEDLQMWKEGGEIYYALNEQQVGEEDATQVIDLSGVQYEQLQESMSSSGQYQRRGEQKPSPSSKKPLWKRWWFVSLIAALLILGLFIGGAVAFWEYTYVPEVSVPELRELSEEEAIEKLEEAGLTEVTTEEDYHKEIEEGYVISQSPSAGSTVKETRQIELLISKGKEVIEIPDLTGKTEAQARALLRGEGLEYEVIKQSHDHTPEGKIIRQEPTPGYPLNLGDKVSIYVSEGRASIPIEDLTGKTREEALQYLEDKGLILGDEEEKTAPVPEEEVVEQHPAPGAPVERGDAVDLVLSEGPEEEDKEEEDKEEEDKEEGEEEEANSREEEERENEDSG